jgi:hypothetical protein
MLVGLEEEGHGGAIFHPPAAVASHCSKPRTPSVEGLEEEKIHGAHPLSRGEVTTLKAVGGKLPDSAVDRQKGSGCPLSSPDNVRPDGHFALEGPCDLSRILEHSSNGGQIALKTLSEQTAGDHKVSDTDLPSSWDRQRYCDQGDP